MSEIIIDLTEWLEIFALVTVCLVNYIYGKARGRAAVIEALRRIVIENKEDDFKYCSISGDIMDVLGLTVEDLKPLD